MQVLVCKSKFKNLKLQLDQRLEYLIRRKELGQLTARKNRPRYKIIIYNEFKAVID